MSSTTPWVYFHHLSFLTFFTTPQGYLSGLFSGKSTTPHHLRGFRPAKWFLLVSLLKKLKSSFFKTLSASHESSQILGVLGFYHLTIKFQLKIRGFDNFLNFLFFHFFSTTPRVTFRLVYYEFYYPLGLLSSLKLFDFFYYPPRVPIRLV